MTGLRDCAVLDTGHRTLIVTGVTFEDQIESMNFLASTDHIEMEELLNNWFQTKEHHESV